MTDYGHELAEESLRKLERRFSLIYSQAEREMREKQRKALENFEKERSQRLKALDDSDEQAVKIYKDWLERETMTNDWLSDMVDELSMKATQSNELAMEALHDTIPGVYAENANYAAFSIDNAIHRDTGFTLIDADTIRNLVMTSGSEATHGGLLPELTFPKIDRPKDYRWNRQKFHQAITQGILQGESIPNIVKRTDDIFGRNKAAAFRAARTATTCAENSGRVSSYERAERIGIELKQEWLAALDSRTRDSHRKLDGEKVDVGEPFESEHGPIRFPGDPQAHPAEVYNCRCTLIADVEGYRTDGAERWSRLPKGTTYKEWKAGKQPEKEGLNA